MNLKAVIKRIAIVLSFPTVLILMIPALILSALIYVVKDDFMFYDWIDYYIVWVHDIDI